MPYPKLILKWTMPIMLLTNLDPQNCEMERDWLSNKCYFACWRVWSWRVWSSLDKIDEKQFSIQEYLLIPPDIPFEFNRLQFPARVSFAMSIIKSQGQASKTVGLHLIKLCLSHGQLYFGYLRVGIGKNLFVLTHNGKTKNIAYHGAWRWFRLIAPSARKLISWRDYAWKKGVHHSLRLIAICFGPTAAFPFRLSSFSPSHIIIRMLFLCHTLSRG